MEHWQNDIWQGNVSRPVNASLCQSSTKTDFSRSLSVSSCQFLFHWCSIHIFIHLLSVLYNLDQIPAASLCKFSEIFFKRGGRKRNGIKKNRKRKNTKKVWEQDKSFGSFELTSKYCQLHTNDNGVWNRVRSHNTIGIISNIQFGLLSWIVSNCWCM